jgi:DNA processing protein
LGIDLVLRDDPAYPPALGRICDPPGVLFCRGKLEPRDELAVAIVGSRRCTVYGRQQAERLAGVLARAGLTIVSGLARGIDAAAHRGALEAGGRTLAVLGTGLAKIYPPEHAELAAAVAQNGAVLAEGPLDTAPLPGLFPQRNRIIAGLSMGVVVIEASRSSGALHTVRHALEQGREVFAVPGRIDSLASEGCHDILRDGATLVRHADDILLGLGALAAPVRSGPDQSVHAARELLLDDQERRILNLVPIDPVHVDEILREAGIEPSRALATLTVLEMRRLVRRLPGSPYCRVQH